MNKQKNKHFKESFRHAAAGLHQAFLGERNFRFHLAATVLALAAGVLLGFSAAEVAVLLLTCGLVLVMELVNTAVEAMVDHLSPEWDAYAKLAKDVAAGAVLLAACVAVGVGLCLFLPRLWALKPVVEQILWN